MALWKIFLVVLLAVLFAVLLVKFWRLILSAIVALIAIIIAIILDILFMPIRIVLKISGYYSEEKLRRKIVEQYDNIFFRVNSQKELIRIMKKIKNLEGSLWRVEEKKRDKEIKKILKECKWAL